MVETFRLKLHTNVPCENFSLNEGLRLHGFGATDGEMGTNSQVENGLKFHTDIVYGKITLNMRRSTLMVWYHLWGSRVKKGLYS